MRCPKCGYISFDFNQVCPKCNKDISDHQNRLNFPPFRPNPPSLLGTLIGATAESNVGLDLAGTHEPFFDQETPDYVESIELHEGIELGEGRVPDVGLDTGTQGISMEEPESEISSGEDLLNLDLGTEEEDISFESEGLSLESEITTPKERGALDSVIEPEMEDIGISLDLEELPVDSGENTSTEAPPVEQDDELLINFDDITLDGPPDEIAVSIDGSEASGLGEGGLEAGAIDEEAGPAVEIDSEIMLPEEKSETDEIELNLDDLKVNETGELEIGNTADFGSLAEETGAVGYPSPDETPRVDDALSEEPVPQSLSQDEEDMVQGISSRQFEDDTLIADELDDLSLEESGPEADEIPGLENFPLEAPNSGESPGDDVFDLDDISVEEDEISLADASLEVEDISLDEFQGDEQLSPDETLEVDDFFLVESESGEADAKRRSINPADKEIDFQKMDVDAEEVSDYMAEDDIALDLENMDLELELDDSSEK